MPRDRSAGLSLNSPAALDAESCQSAAVVRIEGICKAFGSGRDQKIVIHNLSLAVTRSDFASIVGPSGIGKTTLLRCLAGLVPLSAGSIFVNGHPVTAPPADVAVVFQDYSRSLLPWLRVGDNVSLPLRNLSLDKRGRRERSAEALDAVGLSRVTGQYPWELSGGMQQRVAIARALAYRPQVLLMDEPFASVDAHTRLDLEDLLVRVHREFHMTTLFVTHDIDESVYLSDQVVILSGQPASITEVVKIELGRNRDQITTRSSPEFARYRSQILQRIRTPAPDKSIESHLPD